MNEKEKAELKKDIKSEKKAIDESLKNLFQIYKQYSTQKDNFMLEAAMGTYLMNFYNGIENIIKRILTHFSNNSAKLSRFSGAESELKYGKSTIPSANGTIRIGKSTIFRA